MTTFTSNYRLTLPAYDTTGWDVAMDNNLITIDTLLGQFNTGINLQGIWQNSTQYVAGVSVIDPATGFIYTAGITNTSRATGLMAADIAANPSWWTDITNPAISAAASALIASTNAAAIRNSSWPRNRLINGDMNIDQRNSGATVTITPGNSAFLVDRWSCALVAGANAVFNQQATSAIPFTNFLQAVLAAGNTNTNINQRVERANCQDLGSTPVVVSGYAYIDATFTGGLNVNIATGNAPDDFSSEIFNIAENITLIAGAWVQFNKTFILPSTATNGIDVVFNMTGLGSRTVGLSGIQLEKGSTATTFEYLMASQSLLYCQRYFQLVFGNIRFDAAGVEIQDVPIGWTPMRTSPTVTTKQVPSVQNISPSAVHLFANNIAGRYEVTTISTGDSFALGGIYSLSAEL